MKRTNILLKTALLIAATIFSINSATETRAATFAVNSTADAQDAVPGDGLCQTSAPGECTLRAAITEANAWAGDDIIDLPAGVYTRAISAIDEDANAGGDFDVTSNITLNGAGAGTTFIQAAPVAGVASERVLHFAAASSSTVNGVTLRYGRNSAMLAGGGVFISANSNIVFNDVAITHNSARVERGGGVMIGNNCTVAMNDSLIAHNIGGARGGGGINVGNVTATGENSNSTLTLNNTTVSFNQLFDGTTLQDNVVSGAGIRMFGGTLNLNNSSVDNNTLATPQNSGSGVGIGLTGGAATLTNSSVSNNFGNRIRGLTTGGGIYNLGGTLTLNKTIVSGNIADSGAGIATTATTAPAATTINQSAVVNNFAALSAGGVVNQATGTASALTEINNSTIAVNKANDSVGGLANGAASSGNATVNINFSTIAGNVAGFEYTDSRAGGISSTRNSTGLAALNLKNSIVADNSVRGGGACPDICGFITSQGYNHVENTSGGNFTASTGDVVGTDPAIGALMPSGSNSVLIPAANSPVIDAIPAGTNGCGAAPFNVDQRGTPRPTSNGNPVAACEKGAVELAAPTSARVAVGGRVFIEGRALSGVLVILTDSLGETRSARTNSFGYYRFDDVRVGATYIFNVASKSYQFSPQVTTIIEETKELNFFAGAATVERAAL